METTPPSDAGIKAAPQKFTDSETGKVVRLLLQDLRALRKDEADLFQLLFYNREDQINTLIKFIEDSRMLGENILVVASAGVGKTSVLLRCLQDRKLVASARLNPIFCDCRREGDVQPGLAKVREYLASNFKAYLQKLVLETGDDSVVPSSLLRASDPHDQYRLAVRAILDLSSTHTNRLYPILFIDDIDYSSTEAQEELLTMILPLLQSKNIVLIYAVRPPAARTIDFHYDQRIKMALCHARRLALRPISVRGHLTTRMAYLLDEPKDEGYLKGIWRFVTGQGESLQQYVRRFVRDEQGLVRFPYPFNSRVETFMQRITNGNLNELMDITLAVLSYCHDHRDKLGINLDGTVDLHRQDVINALLTPESHYRLLNVHEMLSTKRGRDSRFQNNSTIQNVLEMFCLTHYVDDGFFERLCGKPGAEDRSGLGHTHDEVRRAIDICLNERLIEEQVFVSGGASLFLPKDLDKREVGPFNLTQKGEFYIHDLIFWPAYQEQFASKIPPSRSVFGMAEEGDVGRFEFERSILEFLSLIITVQGGTGYLWVGKAPLYDLFERNYRQAFWHRFEGRNAGDGEGYSTLSRPMFENLIRRRELCSPHKEENRHYFVLRPGKVMRCAQDAGVRTILNPDWFSRLEFEEFCRTHVKRSTEEDAAP